MRSAERYEAVVEQVERTRGVFCTDDLVSSHNGDVALVEEVLGDLVVHGLLRELDIGREIQWIRTDQDPGFQDARSKVYRLWSADGELLYVGCTAGYVRGRLRDHEKRRPWYAEVAKVTVETVAGYKAGLRVERRAIETESPRYNVRHTRLRAVS
jgi:hypothetical protein